MQNIVFKILYLGSILSSAGAQQTTYKVSGIGIKALGDIKGNSRVRKEAEAAINEHIRNVIEHFKQDDPVGLPKELNDQIPDPMPIPDMEHEFSKVNMKFASASVHGLSKFRLDHVQSDLSALKVSVGISIDELQVLGKYAMGAWFSTSKGNFNVTILQVMTEAEAFCIVDAEGFLQVDTIEMDLKFEDIKMHFENLGFFGQLFQGMINSVGAFIFDSIKPLIFEQIQGEIRGVLNREARSAPQQFPNSINPLDMAIAGARTLIRERGLDPMPLPDYIANSWTTFQLTGGILHGLATIHRTGSIILGFEKNVIHISLNVGAENLKGKYNWTLGVFQNMVAKNGVMGFTLEYIRAQVKLQQPANLEKLPTVDGIDLDLGNIAVLSDGAGTLDYILEAFFNVIPNVFRKQIINSLEPIVCEAIENELKKLNLEEMIEEKLKENN